MKKVYFRKSLTFVLIITCLPMLIVGGSFYYIGKMYIAQEVERTRTILLAKSIERIDEQLDRIELMATHWAFNPIFEPNQVKGLNLKTDYAAINDLYQSLFVMKNTNPLIDKIEIYIRNQAATINDIEGIRYLSSSENDRLKALLDEHEALFWYDEFSFQASESSIALLHDLPGSSGNPYGALIIYINPTLLDEFVQEINIDEEYGAAFLFRHDGTRIIKDNRAGELERELFNIVSQSHTDSESFIFRWKGNSYSVSSGKFIHPNLNWNYVTATSLEKMTRPVTIMSQFMVGTGILGLMAAIVLSWIASYRLYQPIRRILNFAKMRPNEMQHPDAKDEIMYIEHQWQHLNRESQLLQERLERNLPALKEAFLSQLLQGHLDLLKEPEIQDRMEQYGWIIKDGQFILAVLQVNGLHPDRSFADGDEQLASFAAANIVWDFTSRYPEQIGSVNFHDLTVGVLFSYGTSMSNEQIKSQFLTVVKDLVQMVETFVKLRVTATVAGPTPSLKQLPDIFETAKQSLHLRNLHQNSQIVDIDRLIPRKEAEIVYDFNLEKQALQAIRIGMLEESIELVEKFYGTIVHQANHELEVREGMLQFLGAIQHTILASGYNPYTLLQGKSAYELLSDQQDSTKFPLVIKDLLIRPYCERLHQDRDYQIKQMVETVIAHINQSYRDNISLESCADFAGTTPYVLSRGFKQITGENFIDYLTSLRLEKAKELLRSTDLKVNVIADKVGYQSSYFIRVFKKSTGITPGQYREDVQSE